MKTEHKRVLVVLTVVVIGVLATLIAVMIGRRAQPPVPNGLVAYYPFDGNAKDASGNQNDGTVTGATLTRNRFGKANSAYYFPGKGSHIAVAHSPTLAGTNAVSVAAWIKVEPGGTEQPRIAHKHVFDLALSDVSGTPNVFFRVSRLEEGSESVTTPPLSSNQWVFVAGTYDRLSLCLYTNGVLVAQTNASIPIETNNLPIGIGRNLESWGDSFKGCIDDVRIYNRALSEAEVQQLYQWR
jgi:hypothetical protein